MSRWIIERPFREPGVYISDSETTAVIAKVYVPDAGAYTNATARLIAAAPDLLAACQTALECLIDPYLGEDDSRHQEGIIAITQALAKAS